MAQLFRAYIEDPARFEDPQAPVVVAATPSQQS